MGGNLQKQQGAILGQWCYVPNIATQNTTKWYIQNGTMSFQTYLKMQRKNITIQTINYCKNSFYVRAVV